MKGLDAQTMAQKMSTYVSALVISVHRIDYKMNEEILQRQSYTVVEV